MNYYKFVHPDGHYGLKYTEGLNIDPNPFDMTVCCNGGIYFAKEDIFSFCYIGPLVYKVVPEGEVYQEKGIPEKYKAHAVNLTLMGNWHEDKQVIIDMIQDGARVPLSKNYLFQIACLNRNLNLVKYLVDTFHFDINDYPNIMAHIVYLRYDEFLEYFKDQINMEHDLVKFVLRLQEKYNI